MKKVIRLANELVVDGRPSPKLCIQYGHLYFGNEPWHKMTLNRLSVAKLKGGRFYYYGEGYGSSIVGWRCYVHETAY
jgi:hypothetical protein